ncbi:ISL3 family transposase, partial [Kitasatospora sp. NPDC088346]
ARRIREHLLPHDSKTAGHHHNLRSLPNPGRFTYHNGRTEGVNTRTKRIMRQMHGRAGFPLLRHRILLQ